MASAKASSSSAPPKVKSTKKSTSTKKSKDKAPQAISPEEVPSDIDSDNLDDDVPMSNQNDDDDGSSSSSSSEADSDEDLENITPKKTSKVVNRAEGSENRGKSLKKYQPPIGMSELKVSSTFSSSPFEWDTLANKPGVELWAIRVPKDLKPSRLSSLSLSIPKSSHGKINGSLKTKSTSYELSTAGTNLHTHTLVNEEGRQPTGGPGAIDSMIMEVDGNDVPKEMKVEGGEEMDGMRLLVPKVKEGGKLFVASKPITRKLILTPSLDSPTTTEEPTLPSFLSTSTTTSTAITQSTEIPKKREQPLHLLKFRNKAYGFETPGPNKTSRKSMDIDEDFNDNVDGTTHPIKTDNKDVVSSPAEKKEKEKIEKKDKKEKKRKSEKVDKDSPKKKSKKSKE